MRDVEITVDGHPLRVAEGTTLASALLGSGVTRFRASALGESRAPLCGMGSCFECRVTVNGVAQQRSCLVSCTAGLRVETGHAAGSAEWDVRCDAAECDVLVVGGGPAGIAAAVRAAERGARAIVVDQNPRPGGQIWRHRARGSLPPLARAWIARLERTGAAWMPCAALAAGSPEHGFLVASGDRATRVRSRAVVLATGARELFLPFPGWTLPGVLGVGGAQALLKGGMDVRGRRVVVAGTGPLLLPVAASLAAAGARVSMVAEQAGAASVARFAAGLAAHPSKLAQAVRYRAALGRVRYHTGTWVARADGDGRVERVTITDGRARREMPCDLLCCAYGLVPNLELPRLLGCEIGDGVVRVDALQRTSIAGVLCAGEPTGVKGELAAIVEGEIAGSAAAGDDAGALAPALQRRRDAWRSFGRRLTSSFAPRADVRALAAADTLVCRCEDVALGALDPTWTTRQAKLYTRLAMGPCQGAVCGSACATLFGWPPPGVRPPVTPVPVGALAVAAGDQEAGSREQGAGREW